jgi:hypothetical protein
MDDLKVKVKKIEGDMSVFRRSTNNFTFQVKNSQVFRTHTLQHEWVIDYVCTHHVEKYASLLSYLDKFVKQKIYVANDFSLDIIDHGDVSY